jgi:hypothetical protein
MVNISQIADLQEEERGRETQEYSQQEEEEESEEEDLLIMLEPILNEPLSSLLPDVF